MESRISSTWLLFYERSNYSNAGTSFHQINSCSGFGDFKSGHMPKYSVMSVQLNVVSPFADFNQV